MPIRLLAIAAIFCLSQSVRAQLFDDFSDSDFSQNPAWSGNLLSFKIDPEKRLQLAAPAAGQAKILLEGEIADSSVWRFWLRLDFAPSTSNRLRVWLLSDSENLAAANGYFLEIGETGSADALRFFRSDAGQLHLLATGKAGKVANEPVLARIEARRKKSGEWKIAADFTGGEAFSTEIEAVDDFHQGGSGRLFGFDCLFTASRKEHFFFDDILIRPDWPDLSPPVLQKTEAIGGAACLAFFDEKLAAASLAPDLFSLEPGIGKAFAATAVLGNEKAVRLDFSAAMTDGQTYFLKAKNMADDAGNVAAEQSASFIFQKKSHPKAADILVTEIMADPSPSAGLPEIEWIEIHNRSTQLIDFEGVTLEIGATKKTFPKFLLPAGGFVLVGDEAEIGVFSSINSKIGIQNFPVLPNTSGSIRLADSSGATLDFVEYDLDFYQNPSKSEGGWSLERRFFERPCSVGAANWAACEKLPGATPAAANSIFSNEADIGGPRFLSAFPLADDLVRLLFDESLDAKTATDASLFRLDQPIDILASKIEKADRRSVILELAEPLEKGAVYEVWVDEKMADCLEKAGEKNQTQKLALPELPEANSLIINELLFDPKADGADFLEILNASKTPISLADLFIESASAGVLDIQKSTVERILFPDEIAVFTPSPTKTERDFEVKNPGWLHENALPSLPDAGGKIRLLRADGLELDALDFSNGLHHILLRDDEKEGRSLERVSPKRPASERSNWASAADSPRGSGTPTATNSQFFDAQSTGDEWFSFSPTVISPNGDGHNDFLQMAMELPTAGFVGSIFIFHESGHLAKTVVDETLVGASATFRWDGDLNDGTAALSGIYIVFAQFLDATTGEILKAKRAFGMISK